MNDIPGTMPDEQPPEEKMVTIPQAEYDYLKKRVDWLECLEAAGVDNWEGYDEARNIRDEHADQEPHSY